MARVRCAVATGAVGRGQVIQLTSCSSAASVMRLLMTCSPRSACVTAGTARYVNRKRTDRELPDLKLRITWLRYGRSASRQRPEPLGGATSRGGPGARRYRLRSDGAVQPSGQSAGVYVRCRLMPPGHCYTGSRLHQTQSVPSRRCRSKRSIRMGQAPYPSTRRPTRTNLVNDRTSADR